MNQLPGLAQIIAQIKSEKPRLLAGFLNAKDCLAAFLPLTPQHLASLKQLVYAGEYLYIDYRQLLPRLVRQGELTLFCDLLYTLSCSGYPFARVLLEAYPGLGFALAPVASQIRFLVKAAAVLPSRGVKVLTICLQSGQEPLCRFMLEQLTLIASHSPGTMADCALLISAKLGALPFPLLRQWLLRGTDLLTSNRVDEGIRFLLLKSRESRQWLGLNHVLLEDYKKILRIYSASLAGRDLHIAGLEISMFKLKTPYTDGATIFLPQEINFFRDPEANERAYTVLAALQAASLAYGTFGLDLQQLDFNQELRQRYGTSLPEILPHVRRQYEGLAQSVHERADGELEVVFSKERKLLALNTEHEKFFYSFPTPDFAGELFNLVENSRIEGKLAALYPGLKQDLLLVNTHLWHNRPEPRINDTTRDRTNLLLAAVESLIQFALLGRWKTEIRDLKFYNILQTITGEFKKILQADCSVADSARVTFAIYNIFFDNFPLITYCAQHKISRQFEGLAKPEIHAEIVLDVSPQLLKAAKPEFVSEQEPQEEDLEVDLSSFREADSKIRELRQALNNGAVRVFRYPEYDYLKNSYRQNRCTLFEQLQPAGDGDYYQQILKQYKQVYRKIRKRFLYMKPEGVELVRRWYSGSEIHMSDAVDYSIALLRGECPDEKIYCRKILNRRDLTVAVLADASSSTDSTLGYGKIIEIEKAALCILASALSVIDDPFGLFTFFSLGPRNVYLNVIKDFHETWQGSTQERIATVKAYAGNRDGCAIRHVTRRLLEQPERSKLLILLSDGIPADLDYGSPSVSDTSRYAIEDTRRAILECRQQNIIPYCITIDRAARQYISHLYGDFHYAVLDDVTRLPEKLAQLYLRLTR